MQTFRRTVRTDVTKRDRAFGGPSETTTDEVEVVIEGETAGDVCVILETYVVGADGDYNNSKIDEESS